MRATPGSGASDWSRWVNASSPPADAPTPTIGKGLSLDSSATTAGKACGKRGADLVRRLVEADLRRGVGLLIAHPLDFAVVAGVQSYYIIGGSTNATRRSSWNLCLPAHPFL